MKKPLNVLAIGGSGHVGQLILPSMASQFQFTIFDRNEPPRGPWNFIRGDALDPHALSEAMNGIDALIYLAVGKPIDDVKTAYDINVRGLHLALEAACRAKVKRVIYASTLSVYDGISNFANGGVKNEEMQPRPKDVHGLTKVFGEEICRFFYRKYRLSVFVLRLFFPVSQKEKDEEPFPGKIDSRTNASDLAHAFAAALLSEHRPFEIFHITGDFTGRGFSHKKAKRILGWEPGFFSLRNRFSSNRERLLQAALLKGEPAIHAWDTYRRSLSPQEMEKEFEEEPCHLLPLLTRNLEEHGLGESLLPKYKGVYRHVWAKNHALGHDAAQAIETLRSAGVETMILKGAALAVTHYKDFGLRPMKDVDVAVKPEKLTRAVRVLKEAGWHCRVATAAYKEFINKEGYVLDVHWFIKPEAWKRALPVSIEKIPAWVLDPTDHLDFIMSTRAWNLLWVADAFMLINHSTQEIDWERLIDSKRRAHRLLTLRTGLHYVSEVLHGRIPEKELLDLGREKTGRREQLHFMATAYPPISNNKHPLSQLKELWTRYCRTVASGNDLMKFAEFLFYLKDYGNMDSWWKMPFVAVAKILAPKNKVCLNSVRSTSTGSLMDSIVVPSENTRVKINGPHITHEIIDSEALIIHLEKGYYYSLDKVGTLIWDLIARNASWGCIIDHLAKCFGNDRQSIEKASAEFMKELLEEELILFVKSDSLATDLYTDKLEAGAEGHVSFPFTKPVLQKFTDMKDFLLVDPIHDVDEAGWPHKK